MKKLSLPTSPVASVRADTPIEQCVRIMRDRGIGALVVVSDNAKEEIVGIFTERDLLKEIELIHKGNFWANPIRAIMTSRVKTISPDELDQAPEIMASLNIRHLPIVTKEKGRTRVVGVVSMRDIFRTVMERYDYKIEKILNPVALTPAKRRKRMLGFFTTDESLKRLLDKAGKLAKHLVVSAGAFTEALSAQELVDDFDAVCIDLEGLPENLALRAIDFAGELSRRIRVLLVFQPVNLSKAQQEKLTKLVPKKTVIMLSKPVAFGILYEHFLKGF